MADGAMGGKLEESLPDREQMDEHIHLATKKVYSMTVLCRLVRWSIHQSVHQSAYWSIGPSVVRWSVSGYQARDLWQSAMLLRLLRAPACFSVRFICIMKSNRNPFCVNSGGIAHDCQFIIADPNEIKTHLFATAS